MAQAVDADLLARCMAWAGETEAARNETFNVANGDVFTWPNVWPALADAFGMQPGSDKPLSMEREIAPRETDWARIRERHTLLSPGPQILCRPVVPVRRFPDGIRSRRAGRPSPSRRPSSYLQAGFHDVA